MYILFRCHCSWEKTDHDYIPEELNADTKHEPWKPDDVKLRETNAFGEIEFHAGGKPRMAKVSVNFSGSM